MIEYIRGEIVEIEPTVAVIENCGIGYEVNITLIDYPKLEENRDACKLYIHEIIREDAHTLYGFLTKEARSMFRMLIGVNGVGAGTARLILSSMSVYNLEKAITECDENSFKSVKGVGAKTAQRIILDLKDKIKVITGTLIEQSGEAFTNYEEALAALVTLGFTQQASQKALKKIFSDYPTASLENAIKMALKMM